MRRVRFEIRIGGYFLSLSSLTRGPVESSSSSGRTNGLIEPKKFMISKLIQKSALDFSNFHGFALGGL